MAKRFTDTEIWSRCWYRKLSPIEKIAFNYVKDRCDNVGVWNPDFELADFCIGAQVEWEALRENCNGNIEVLENGKWFLPDFCEFQYGELNKSCLPHRSYIALLQKHGLEERVGEGYPKGTVRVKEKEKEKDKEKEEEKKVGSLVVEKELYHFITNRFKNTLGYDYKREGKHVKQLVQKALAWPRGSPEAFLDGVIKMFEYLVTTDAWWKKQPFLPSVLNSNGIWPRVLKEIENRGRSVEEKRQEYQEAAAVAAKVWKK